MKKLTIVYVKENGDSIEFFINSEHDNDLTNYKNLENINSEIKQKHEVNWYCVDALLNKTIITGHFSDVMLSALKYNEVIYCCKNHNTLRDFVFKNSLNRGKNKILNDTSLLNKKIKLLSFKNDVFKIKVGDSILRIEPIDGSFFEISHNMKFSDLLNNKNILNMNYEDSI